MPWITFMHFLLFNSWLDFIFGHIHKLCMIPWQVWIISSNFFIFNPVNLEFSKQYLSIDLVCGTALGHLWTYFKPVSHDRASSAHITCLLMRLWICSALDMTWGLGLNVNPVVCVRLYLFLPFLPLPLFLSLLIIHLYFHIPLSILVKLTMHNLIIILASLIIIIFYILLCLLESCVILQYKLYFRDCGSS